MEKDVYKNIEEALLAQNYLDEDEFSPDTDAFHTNPKRKTPSPDTSMLDGSTTMYVNAANSLNTTNNKKVDIGSLDKVKDMNTAEFLGETDFLGYTDYMEGKKIRRSSKDRNDSYEVSGDENDNPFRNVFGLGRKKQKPVRSTSGARHSSGSRNNNTSSARQAAKTTAKGARKTVSAGKQAAFTLIHTIQLIVRIFSTVLMLACAYQIGDGCYIHREDLGSIAMMVQTRNYAQISFITVAVLAVLYALISACTILAARRRTEKGRDVNGDYGQGFFPFLLFLLLGIAAFIVPDYLPQMTELEGFLLFLTVIQNRGPIFLQINVIGALLCMARKLTHRF